jgi:hypothetical protein
MSDTLPVSDYALVAYWIPVQQLSLHHEPLQSDVPELPAHCAQPVVFEADSGGLDLSVLARSVRPTLHPQQILR